MHFCIIDFSNEKTGKIPIAQIDKKLNSFFLAIALVIGIRVEFFSIAETDGSMFD